MKPVQRFALLCAAALMTAAALVFTATAAQGQQFEEGRHYKLLPRPAEVQVPEGKVEVREFFWYGCPHCYTLEPHIAKWKKPAAVEFVTTPALLGKNWVPHAYAYYALKALGRLEELHSALFDAVHARKRRVYSLKQIAAFLEEHGIEREKFEKTVKSFVVETQVKSAERLGRTYAISGVPTFVVNGKYVTSPSMTGDYDTFFRVIDYLVAKEAGARS